jgi:signal transduction histidine kinase
MCRSPAAVGDRAPIRTGAAVHARSDGSGQVRYLRPADRPAQDSPPILSLWTGRAQTALGGASERRRLERDLHDSVQSELVALIVKLATTRQDPDTPPAIEEMLAGLEARAQAALDSVRNIARGIFPPVLADFGLRGALRALAARATIRTSVVGTAPRGTEEAEEAVYFACSEAIQNVVKHAGDGSRVTIHLQHHYDSLVVHISDDGGGFDPDQTPGGTGLRNIRDRIEDLGGSFKLDSKPGCGTVVALSLAWPPAAERQP